MADQTRLTREQREQRDQNALRLFLGGATYRAIAEATGFRSVSGVHRVVQQQLAASVRRRTLLTDEALAIHQERTERLFQAHWARALKGDHRSSELCERILARNARLYGLAEEINPSPLPAPTSTLDHDDDDELDELEKIRARRRAGKVGL